MVAIGIAGIIMALAIPAMGDFMRNARMTQAANDVLAAMHYARSESIKRRVPVVICSSTNPLAASPACAATAALTGWVVFVDSNGNGAWDAAWTYNDIDGDGRQDTAEIDLNGDGWNPNDPAEDVDDDDHQDVDEPNVDEQVLARHEPLPDTISAAGSLDPLSITYLPTGVAEDRTAGQLVLCDARGNASAGGELSTARGIAISAAGRPEITRDTVQIQALVDAIGTTIGGCD
ncbi:MAG: GspH/FimT family pseudopilin [Gammaproteobacteria bacterium]|nr:GspH/FimT family pseudopilin [Gammaproteobacteria bacterium]